MHRKKKEQKPAMTQQRLQAGRRDFLVQAGMTVGALAVVSPPARALTIAAAQGGSSAHLHATAHQIDFKSEPQRLRKSFYDLTDVEVRLLCRAVGYMRSGSKDKPLSVDSPLQWDQWVMTHARHCTEAKPGVVDQVHWSWFFLPWHRGYLWFLERQLANIVTTVLGEDGSKFALPFWDWISHKEIPNTKERAVRGIPSPLFGYDLLKEDMVNDDGLGFDNQALWDGYRKPTVQQPTMDPLNEKTKDSKEHIEETIKYMSPPFVQSMLALEFEDFAGKAVPPQSPIPNSTGMGALEHYPHNNGHDWVGSRFGKNRDMGTLRYAALDPIFCMHHANIDRVWSWYRGVQPDPDAPWGPNGYIWGKQPYTYTNTDGSQVTVTVSDIIKYMTNVTYAEPQSPVPMEMPLLTAARTTVRRQTNQKIVTLTQKPDTLTTKPLTLTTEIQADAKTLLGAASDAKTHPLTLLVIETGPITYTDKFTIKIFVNKPDATRLTGIHDPHYIGRIRALDSDDRAKEAGSDVTHTFSLLIPAGDSNFYRLVRPGTPFSVTLVVVGPAANDGGFQVPVKSIKLKVTE
jgi:polyphenol oxidase